MEIRVSNSVIIVLLFALLCCTYCSGIIFPCSNNSSELQNKTLSASVNQSVSFRICVESTDTIYHWIKISHPNHKTNMHPQPSSVTDPGRLGAQVARHHHRAYITITVNQIELADFNEPFSVTLFAASESGQRLPENSSFFFVIQETVHPAITWFTLQEWDYRKTTIIWSRNLLDSNNTSVTIPATNYYTLNVTCQASGFPKPEVAVVLDNETLEMLPNGVALITHLNYSYSRVFICQAANMLSSDLTHIRVMISVADAGKIHPRPPQFDASVVFAVGASVGVIVGVTIIVALFLVRAFFQKRAQRSEAVSQDVVPNTEYKESAGNKYESATQETPAMDDLEIVQHIQIEDDQYERPVACIHSRGLISNVLKSDVEYANTVTPL